MRALDEEAIEETFNYPHRARVLFVFDDLRGLKLVVERMSKHPLFREFKTAFYAKTLDEIGIDFVDGWRHFCGERVSLF